MNTDNNFKSGPNQDSKPVSLKNILIALFEEKEETTGANTETGNNPPPQKQVVILKYLKPIPWVLTGGFILSFFWDFNGLNAQLFGLTLHFEGLLKICTISGLIGFLTNWIAITMLFRPLKKRPILGQGLIPAHKERIAYRLSKAVSEDLINADIIKKKISDSDAVRKYREQTFRQLSEQTQNPEFREEFKYWISSYLKSSFSDPRFKKVLAEQITDEVEQGLDNKIIEKTALKTYSILKDKPLQHIVEEALAGLPESVDRNIDYVEVLLDELPSTIENSSEDIDDFLNRIIHRLVNKLNVQHLVEENLKNYDEQKLERMIRNATNEQLRTIQYLGAVLGTIGGFVIWEPILSLTVLGLFFSSVYFVDRLLYS